MIDKIKDYMIEVGMKRYAPMAAMAAMGAVGTFMAAHAGLLEQYGVTYGDWSELVKMATQPSGPCILIELDTASTAAIASVIAIVTVLMRGTEHHVATVVTTKEEPKQ